MFHIALHFIVPALLVGLLYKNKWKSAYLAMVATMLMDLDHLLANPVYDPNRCSIGFHPLHEPWMLSIYIALCFVPKLRFIGLGFVIHMSLDSIDCQFTNGIWMN